jgi:hypothetical protein
MGPFTKNIKTRKKPKEGRNGVDLLTPRGNSTGYEKPDDNLVSFERKDKPTDYEYEAEDANVQQTMRKTIKYGENAPLLEGDLKAGQRTRSPEGTSVQGFGTTSDIKGKGKGKPLSFKDIEQGFEKNLKTATAHAKSAFKHWETKGIIRKGQKFESLPSKERALLTDMAYQLGSSGLRKYKKLATSLASGKSPNKENVKKELGVTWKPPGKLRKKDTRRNEIRRKAYAN